MLSERPTDNGRQRVLLEERFREYVLHCLTEAALDGSKSGAFRRTHERLIGFVDQVEDVPIARRCRLDTTGSAAEYRFPETKCGLAECRRAPCRQST